MARDVEGVIPTGRPERSETDVAFGAPRSKPDIGGDKSEEANDVS